MIFRSILVAAAVALACVAVPAVAQTSAGMPVSVPPTDPNISYIGRWDRTDASTYHGYWGGVYLRARFTGTSVAINLGGGTGMVVSIDGEAFRGIDGGGGAPVALQTSPLKSGTHTVLVGSAGQNYEVLFKGLVLDPGASTLPLDEHRPLIEYIGDSITTLTGSPVGTVNWTWNTAEALGCDHTQIAFSGLSLTSGFGCIDKKVGLDKLYLLMKNYNHLDENPQVPWNFSYSPDVVVINLGQNDQCGSEPAATMQASYLSFLHMLRGHFPNAQIVAIRPFGGAYAESIRTAVHTVITAGDTRVHYVDTAGWITPADTVDSIHPNGIGNLIIMGHLVPILRPLLPTAMVTAQ